MATMLESSHLPEPEDMAPNVGENVEVTEAGKTQDQKSSDPPIEIVWSNVIKIGFLHAVCPVALYLALYVVTWKAIAFSALLLCCSGLGVTAGAHRLWCHRSYKAKLPLRVILAVFNCIACQNNLYVWCRDHRVHHRFSETNADPHNSKRGFFFAHVGWLLVKKHPDVTEKGKSVSLQDLLEDPVVYWQSKFFFPGTILLCFIFPALIPHYLWGENLLNAFLVCSLGRYCLTLNMSWFVNSAAHLYGNRPYNHKISAFENVFVSLFAMGEGFHNYHHTFPMDYSTSELGWYLNPSTFFIDCMALIGQAYDLNTVPKENVRKVMSKNVLSTNFEEQHHPAEASEDSYAFKTKGE